MSSSDWTVLILFFCLMGLIILLVFLCKKLNKLANGEYTVRRMVFKEGGLRDRVRSVTSALGTRLGVPLWPRGDAHKDGVEMREVRDEEAQVREGDSQGSSDSEDDGQEEEDNVERCHKTREEGGGTSDDTSSLESSEAGELIKPSNRPKANREMEEQGQGREEKGGGGEGSEFSTDLKQFSRSAFRSEVEVVTSEVTPL